MKPIAVKVRPLYIIIPVILIILLKVWLDSPAPDLLRRWAIRQVIANSVYCQNDPGWLKPVAKFIIAQSANRDLVTSLSIFYLSANSKVSTCVAGWNGKLFDSPKTNSNTIYEYASVTKIFTADIVLALVRKRQLALNDKLVDLLPELQNAQFQDSRIKDITIEHLLAHQAGFNRLQIGIGDVMFRPKPWCPRHVQTLTDYQLQFTPGEYIAYSNLGFCLLGRVIEEKTKLSYRQAVKNYYGVTPNLTVNFVDNESVVDKSNSAIRTMPEDLDFFDYSAISAAAGLYGDAKSLAYLLRKVETHKHPNVLDVPTNLVESCTPKETKGCPIYMGYKLSKNPDFTLYWRDGSMPVAASMAVLDNKGGVLVILNNAERSGATEQALVRYIYDYRYIHHYF